MTLEELKSMSNLQARLQEVILHEYGVSLPATDLVRRAALKPELLHLDKFEKPLYAVCMLYRESWVKGLLDEINSDYNTKDSVVQYIEQYFKERGADTREDIERRRNNAISALPITLQKEPTCDNFKICKYIELSELEEGRVANITDALVANKEAFVDYGGCMEDLIDDGVPIDMANRIASKRVNKKFKLAETLAKPVKMSYEIRDNVEQSIAAGLGEYGDQYLANRAAIRERKAQYKNERMEAKQQAKIDKIKGQGVAQQRNQYGPRNTGYNSYGQSSMYGNQRMGFGRRGYRYGNSTYGRSYGRRAFGFDIIALLISILMTVIAAVIGLVKGSVISIGFVVCVVGLIVTIIAIIKKHANERNWVLVSLLGIALGVAGMIIIL